MSGAQPSGPSLDSIIVYIQVQNDKGGYDPLANHHVYVGPPSPATNQIDHYVTDGAGQICVSDQKSASTLPPRRFSFDAQKQCWICYNKQAYDIPVTADLGDQTMILEKTDCGGKVFLLRIRARTEAPITITRLVIQHMEPWPYA